MPEKIVSLEGYTREQFFGSFVKYLNETQGFIVEEEKKPESIRFNIIPPALKKGLIELRPTGKGFDVYVDMAFKMLYMGAAIGGVKGNIKGVILKAISRARAELTSGQK